MNPLAAALDLARRLATVVPDPRAHITVDELALALHIVENDGRVARFGSAVCHHREKAHMLFEQLQVLEER